MKKRKLILMHKYDHRFSSDHPRNRKSINLIKIEVETDEDKEQLLLASEYIHGLRNINTDYRGANLLAHLYLVPDKIVVKGPLK